MIDLTTPHVLTNDEFADLANLDEATKSSFVADVQRHVDYLRVIAAALGLSSAKSTQEMSTKIQPTAFRLLD